MNILCLDVGGTFIKFAVMNQESMLTNKGKVKTPRTNQADFIDAIAEIVDNLVVTIDGIAISLPGTIDSEKGYVSQGGSLTYNSKTNLKQILVDRFKKPVTLENDARCATRAEMVKGNMRGIKDGIVLTFGTGIGGCLIIDHKIHYGHHFFSGEVSVVLDKPFEQAGMEAFFGTMGSIPLLLKKASQVKNKTIEDGKLFFEMLENDDELAQLFQQYCDDVARQLYNFQVIIDPQRICIGGGVSENPVFINGIKEAYSRLLNNLPFNLRTMGLMPCQFYNDSNLIGAYHRFQEKS